MQPDFQVGNRPCESQRSRPVHLLVVMPNVANVLNVYVHARTVSRPLVIGQYKDENGVLDVSFSF